MLPKSKRVKKPLFDKAFKGGQSFRTKFFLVKYLQEKDTFWAAVAPNNIYKKAHDRNKARRSVYNAIRKLGEVKKPGVYVAVLQKSTTPPRTNELREDLRQFFK
mgnify:CR=1 FL=1